MVTRRKVIACGFGGSNTRSVSTDPDPVETRLVLKWQKDHPGEPLTGVSVLEGKKVLPHAEQTCK